MIRRVITEEAVKAFKELLVSYAKAARDEAEHNPRITGADQICREGSIARAKAYEHVVSQIDALPRESVEVVVRRYGAVNGQA